MTKNTRLELTGAAGSPYTRKMLGVLRYRHIPYSVFWGNGNIPDGYPAPKVRLLPTFKYQAKCLGWLRDGHNALSDNERGAVDAMLAGSGCEALFK